MECQKCKTTENIIEISKDEYLYIPCFNKILEKRVEKNLKNTINTEVNEDTLKNINNMLADMGIDAQVTFLKSISEHPNETD